MEITYCYPLPAFHLLIVLQLIWLERNPTACADSGMGKNRRLRASVRVGSQINNPEIRSGSNTAARLIPISCSIGNERELIPLRVHAFGIVIKPHNVPVDQSRVTTISGYVCYIWGELWSQEGDVPDNDGRPCLSYGARYQT